MPEAIAVVAVVVLTLIAWVGAWLQARNPAENNSHDDLARLRHHAAFLADRLAVARREGWDEQLVANLARELTATMEQLEDAQARVTGRAV